MHGATPGSEDFLFLSMYYRECTRRLQGSAALPEPAVARAAFGVDRAAHACTTGGEPRGTERLLGAGFPA